MESILVEAKASISPLGLKWPKDSRVSRTPSRFRDTTVLEDLADNGESKWRRDFFEAVDLMNSEIERRFGQAGMSTAAKREKVLLDSAKGLVSDADLTTLQLPQMDIASLGLPLRMLGGLTKEHAFNSVKDAAGFESALHPQTRGLFSEVEKPIHLCLSLPVSTVCSERSFSALRRLKTWLRSTVTQRRLTHMALLHVYKEILDDLDLQAHIAEFISRTPEHKSTFGVRKSS